MASCYVEIPCGEIYEFKDGKCTRCGIKTPEGFAHMCSDNVLSNKDTTNTRKDLEFEKKNKIRELKNKLKDKTRGKELDIKTLSDFTIEAIADISFHRE